MAAETATDVTLLASKLVTTSILEPIDLAAMQKVLTSPPFIVIKGVHNIRGLGGLAITNKVGNHDDVSNNYDGDKNLNKYEKSRKYMVRHGKLFRSANLSRITSEGKEVLKELNVGAVFDLRMFKEVSGRDPTASTTPLSGQGINPHANAALNGLPDLRQEGIVVQHIPFDESVEVESKNVDWATMIMSHGVGDDGLVKSYAWILDIAGRSFGRIMKYLLAQARLDEAILNSSENESLEHGETVKAEEGKACLWNCFVGKDRTGVFTALLLEFLGVEEGLIIHDYTLSRIGLEPMRPALLEKQKEAMKVNLPAVITLASSNASLMKRFLEVIRTDYGGARSYFVEYAGMTDAELDTIRAWLVVPVEDVPS